MGPRPHCLGTQIRPVTEFPGRARPLVLVCTLERPQAVCFVHISLYIGLFHGLWSFLCSLVRVPGQTS